MNNFFKKTEIPQNGAESFSISGHKGDQHAPVVLCAVGAGGQPKRYRTLLKELIEFSD